MGKLITVGDFIEKLQEFPKDWEVKVATTAGGGIAIEHREIGGKPVIGVFGSNGGIFGENPLTEEEYKNQSDRFLELLRNPNVQYTTIHGDHRLYHASFDPQASCYGYHFDKRIVERMVDEGLIDEETLNDPFKRFGA